ncbi:MAG: type I secretion system permease/ATPase [Novosphingobium sp.]
MELPQTSPLGFQAELSSTIRKYRSAFVTVAILSAVLNVLLLSGSIYMMMVYDSVLPSHSLPTLFGLFAMITGAYLFQGFFEHMRSRILGDVGAAFDRQLSRRVQEAISTASLRGSRMPGDGLGIMRDVEQIRAYLSGSGPASLIDMPWVVFFILVLGLLNIWLGVVALVGALVLVGLTVLTDRITREPTARIAAVAGYRNGMAETLLRHAELFVALGMRGRMLDRWDSVNRLYLGSHEKLAHSIALVGGAAKVFRLFIQSAVLTVGALLVIEGSVSGGIIFASSILLGRALAPIDQVIANWRQFAMARQGWERLDNFLNAVPPSEVSPLELPRPSVQLSVEQLTVVPPGTQVIAVQNVTFSMLAGSALGIIGPSAAGKSSLGRALIGIWPAARGNLRLDGATLDQWSLDRLGAMIGYLPQTVELLDGTIAENIARFEPDASSDEIIAAAQTAGVHDLVLALPQGYNTPIGPDGANLSAGQRQRIGLARALYGDPFLVLLDEPNSNLDAAGESALQGAITAVKNRGGIALVIAHRPSVLAQVDFILVLQSGRADHFGPRDEVLKRIAAAPPPVAGPGPSTQNLQET